MSQQRYLFAVTAFTLAPWLVACGEPLDNRVKAAVTQKQVQQGTELHCRESVSGQCHIFVYTEECSLPQQDANTRSVSCTARVNRRLAVPAGGSTLATDLPQGYIICVSTQAQEGFPNCIFAPPWVRQMQQNEYKRSEVVTGE